MKFKKIMLITLLLLAVLTIGAASATDENTTSDELTGNEDLNLESSIDENLDLEINNLEDNKLTDNSVGTFSELSGLINELDEQGNLNLKKDYINNDSFYSDGINITTNQITIDGQGHTLDAKGSSRIFNIQAPLIVIKNIIFKNGQSDSGGGAVYSNTYSPTIKNCYFLNCSSEFGGAIAIPKLSQEGITDCTFINCTGNYGSAISGAKNGKIISCNFINCSGAGFRAAAVNGANLYIQYCNFNNCSAWYCANGGAIYVSSSSDIIECGFINCQAGCGGAIYTENGANIQKCFFENCSAYSNEGGAIRNGNIENCTFKDCFGNDGGAICYGNVKDSSFINCSSFCYGGAVRGCELVQDCSFLNCSAYEGGAIYGSRNITGCSFMNCSAKTNGATIIFTSKGFLNNCIFTNSYPWYSEYPVDVPEVTVDGIKYNFHFNLLSDSSITLTKDYLIYSPLGVNVDNIVIDGNDNTLTFSIFSGRSFYIEGENVIIKNFIFNHTNIYSNGKNTTLINCSFINCSSHVVSSENTANIINCNFINCSSSSSGIWTSNVIEGNIDVFYCNFINCFTSGMSCSIISTEGKVVESSFINCYHLKSNGNSIVKCPYVFNCSFVNYTCLSSSYNFNLNSRYVFNCSFVNCFGRSEGGVIRSYSGGKISNCSFINCHMDKYKYGGAIYVYDSSCNITDCNFNNCSVIGDGGAIYFASGTKGSIVNNCSFINCSSSESGGAIYFNNEGTILNCNFEECYSNKYGGAIYNTGSNCNVNLCNFNHCISDNGGAIYNTGSNCNITLCTFNNCFVHSVGGAIYNSGTDCTLMNSNFINNTASRGFSCHSGYSLNKFNNTYIESDIEEGTFTALQKKIDDAEEASTITLENDYTYDNRFMTSGIEIDKTITIDGNGHTIDATSQSRIFDITGNNIILKNTIFKNGHISDSNSGGAIYINGANCTVDSCTFTNCSSSVLGGAIYNTGANCNITSCTFTNCSAYNGGAIHSNRNMTITSCTFLDCSSHYLGKAICNYFNTNCSVINCKFSNLNENGVGYKVTFINCIFGYNAGYEKTFTALQNKIDESEGNSTITLENDYEYYGGFSTSGIIISKSLTIDGNGHTIDAKSQGRIFYITASNVVLKNITFTNGYSGIGGAIYINGANCTVDSCTFNNCSASYYGGAIYNWGANCTVNSCTFTDCSASSGGAIYNGGTNCIIMNSNFINNTASRGFSYYSRYSLNESNNTYIESDIEEGTFTALQKKIDDAEEASTITLENDYTYDNRFMTSGIEIDKTITIDGNGHTIDANSQSGIFYITASNVVLKNIILINGNANGGGAIYNWGVNCTVNTCIFNNCSVYRYNDFDFNFTLESYGGAICNYGTNFTVDSCTFTDCYSDDYGGAIANTYKGSIIVISSTFNNCSASSGGSIHNSSANCTAINCNFSNSNESEAGYNVTFINCTFGNISNTANTTETNSTTPKTTVTTVSIDSACVYVNDNVVIRPSVTCDGETINGSVDILVDNVKITSVSIGSTYNYVPTASGEYSITASFTATDDYNASVSDAVTLTVTIKSSEENSTDTNTTDNNTTTNETETNTTVTKVSTSLTASKVTATYAVSKKLTVTLKDADGNALASKKITIKVGTISKTLNTDSNGQASVVVSSLVPKTYSATVKFAGDDNYTAYSKSVSVVVKKATPKITAKAKTFKKATKTKKYTITLKNNLKKVMKKAKVYIKVNGKTYSAKTNSKGKATFKITKLTKKGTFKSTITYKGNSYYNKVTKKVKIKVK